MALTEASGAAVANLGVAGTVTLTGAHGTPSPTTLTIPHGQSTSSGSLSSTPRYPLLVFSDTVTARAPSLISATAVLNAL